MRHSIDSKDDIQKQIRIKWKYQKKDTYLQKKAANY